MTSSCKLFTALSLALLVSITFSRPTLATKAQSDLIGELKARPSGAKIRLDAGFETNGGELFLPLLPNAQGKRRGKAHITNYFPNSENPEFIFCDNGWCFVRVHRHKNLATIANPAFLPDNMRKALLSAKFPSDLLVPDGFVLPASLKALGSDVSVGLQDDQVLFVSKHDSSKATGHTTIAANGTLFLTSLTSGTITMVGEHNLNKLADFPTEGTPCSMAWHQGLLYITDQAKHRILLLDAARRQFLGQIDMPPKSAPKGLAILPNGRLLYVSESMSNDIAIIETVTRKVLMRTKVAPGPGRIALTPNGNFLLVLNVPSGQLTILSTLTQQVMATIKLGTVPTCIAITSDSQLAYISNRTSNTVSIVDIGKRQVLGTLPTGEGPTGLALNRDNSKLYVANARENSIAVYDTKTRQKLQDVRLPIEVDFPGSISFLPDGKRLLISSESTDSIAVLDTERFEFSKHTVIGHSSHDILWVPVN